MGRQGSSGVVRGRQGSSGVVRSRQESSAIEVVRVARSRQESSAEIGQLLLPSLFQNCSWCIYVFSTVSILEHSWYESVPYSLATSLGLLEIFASER